VTHVVLLAATCRFAPMFLQYAGRVDCLTIVACDCEHPMLLMVSQALSQHGVDVAIVEQPGTGIGAALQNARHRVLEMGGNVFVVEDDIMLPRQWSKALGIYRRRTITSKTWTDEDEFTHAGMMGITPEQYDAVTQIRLEHRGAEADRRIIDQVKPAQVDEQCLHLTDESIGSFFASDYEDGISKFWEMK